MTKHFDFCVIGAGLAGLHTAKELLSKKRTVCIIDPNGIAGGASGTPVGLANPATGRYASLSWEAEKSLQVLSYSLKNALPYSESPFYKQTGILRPALEENIALKMQKNLDSDPWKEGNVKWLDEYDVKKFHPGIECKLGGVWIPIGLTVHIPKYLYALRRLIKENGGEFLLNERYELSLNDNWKFKLKRDNHFTADNVIFTSGIWTTHFEYWSHLKMHPVKGQTLILEADSIFSFSHAVSALGYISQIDENSFILGSTYEHQFDHTEPDSKGERFMLDRLKRVLPELAQNSKVVSNWAGIRGSTPDRKPYTGTHPTLKNCYIFAGLGSKGLLYSAYGAQLLIEHIINSSPIPKTLDINRFA